MNEAYAGIDDANKAHYHTITTSENDHHRSQKYLSFICHNTVFGISISKIKEIIEYEVVTRVPMVPTYIRGVMNLRGSVVPVIDLAVRLGKSATVLAKRTSIVVLEIEDNRGDKVNIGLLVDAVNEVIEVAAEAIADAPAFGGNIRPEFISGMGKVGSKFLVILDADNILSIEELSSLGLSVDT